MMGYFLSLMRCKPWSEKRQLVNPVSSVRALRFAVFSQLTSWSLSAASPNFCGEARKISYPERLSLHHFAVTLVVEYSPLHLTRFEQSLDSD